MLRKSRPDRSARNRLICSHKSFRLCGLRVLGGSPGMERRRARREWRRPRAWGRGPAGEVRGRPQEPQTVRAIPRGLTRKNPNRERLGLGCWWWECNPHQTTIESTRCRRSGKLRNPAGYCEKWGLTGWDRQMVKRFFWWIGYRNGLSTACAFRCRFDSQTRNRTRARHSRVVSKRSISVNGSVGDAWKP